MNGGLRGILAVALAAAMTGPGHADVDLSWHAVTAGGGTATGASYTLTGSIAQPAAGAAAGGTYALAGGLQVDPPPCPADVNGSGDVGFGDILAIIAQWGPCAGCSGDVDGSGDVGFGDILAAIAQWGPCE